MTQEIQTTEINITPNTSVYSTYEKLSYQQSSAYAEFIDNSTQSYFDNKETLDSLPDAEGCVIKINHDSVNGRITIEDNCFGMELDDFQRAIVLKSEPKIKTGRNEFGMGLKTAACWFGKKWTVRSTRYGSNDEYETTVDVAALAKYKNEKITVKIKQVPRDSHYTFITIENLNRSYPTGRGLGKMRDVLGRVYSRDIRNSNVKIYYNDELVKTPKVEILETEENGEIKRWEKPIEFVVEYMGKQYPVKGFAALRKKGSSLYAGFQLFRRNRVVLGGFGDTYKPMMIFRQPQSFRSQRLFGEFDLDDWPVSQAKDKFDWDDELEELFVKSVHKLIPDLEKQADEYRVNGPKEPPVNPPGPNPPVEQPPVNPPAPINHPVEQPPIKEGGDYPSSGDKDESPGNSSTNIGDTVVTSPVIVSPPRTLPIDLFATKNYQADVRGDVYQFEISFKEFESSMMYSKSTNDYNFKLIINLKHPFVEKCSSNPDSLDTLVKMLIYLCVAEKRIELGAINGKVSANSIRNELNMIDEWDVKEV